MVGYPHGRDLGQERWWQKKGTELGKTLGEIGTSLESDQQYRVNRARESLSLYEGHNMRGLHAGAYGGAYTLEHSQQEYNLNVTRAACDTVIAEIAGRQKPMPKFQTSGADWKTKRRAKQMEKFCLAVLNQPQANFLHAWELMESCFLDAAVWGEGVAKVFYQQGRIKVERHYAHELYVDPVEAVYGTPKNLFHIYIMERDLALWNFAMNPALEISKARSKQLAAAIIGAEDVDPEIYGNNPRVAKAIKIVEGWRLEHESGEPGKHAFAIGNDCLHEEEWTRSRFPFGHMYWEQDRMGFHGKSLVEQGESIHKELNTNAVKMQERFKLCGAKRTYVETASTLSYSGPLSVP